jgi:hypothetical protein
MKKGSTRQWDYLAVAAIVLAVAGLAVYINPVPTGEVYRAPTTYLTDEDNCADGEIATLINDTRNSDGTTAYRDWDCEKVGSFSPNSLPLAGVFGVAALLLLVLRLRPASTRQNR